ncbi:hypothetical protein [Microbacterium hydrocarbonoxydans]|nr:hypothetical protein [Microbacterium hydrocarbonoxydans]
MSMTGDHEGTAHEGAVHESATRGTVVRVAALRARQALADIPRAMWFVAAGLIVLVVVVAAMGGLAQAQASPTELGPGGEARTSVYAVTVQDAEFTDAVESEYLEAEPGEKLLVMTLEMQNLSDAPVGVGTTADRTKAGFINTEAPLLDLVGTTAVDSAAVWRGDGSAGQVILQPGVPSEVTIAWTVPEDAFPDGVVTLDVHEVEVRRGAVILSSGVVTWRAAETSARILIPAEESP